MAESRALAQLAELVAGTLDKHNLIMASAESCTGGLVSAAVTDISGSSVWFKCGSAVYSNEVKSQMLGVPTTLTHEHGAVDEPVAHAMAEGAVLNSRTQVTVATAGVTGPIGDAPDKPVGMACFSWNNRLQTRVETRYFKGDRKQVHLQATEHALRGLLNFLDSAEC